MTRILKSIIGAAALTALATSAMAASPNQTINLSLTGAKLPLTASVDKMSVAPGHYIIKVKNTAKIGSEPVIVAQLRKTDQGTLDELKNNAIRIGDFKQLATFSGIKAGSHMNFNVKLKAGDYVLLTHNKSGYQALIAEPLTVKS